MAAYVPVNSTGLSRPKPHHSKGRHRRLADGWYLDRATRPEAEVRQALDIIEAASEAVGRGAGPFSVDGTITLSECSSDDEVTRQTRAWLALPASHLTVDSMGLGATTVDAHLLALERGRTLVGAALGDAAV